MIQTLCSDEDEPEVVNPCSDDEDDEKRKVKNICSSDDESNIAGHQDNNKINLVRPPMDQKLCNDEEPGVADNEKPLLCSDDEKPSLQIEAQNLLVSCDDSSFTRKVNDLCLPEEDDIMSLSSFGFDREDSIFHEHYNDGSKKGETSNDVEVVQDNNSCASIGFGGEDFDAFLQDLVNVNGVDGGVADASSFTEVIHAKNDSSALIATQVITKGSIVENWFGHVMLATDVKKLQDPKYDPKYINLYSSFVVECTYGGTKAVHVTHSCDPNCEVVVEYD